MLSSHTSQALPLTLHQANIPSNNPWNNNNAKEQWRTESILGAVMDENAKLAHEVKTAKEQLQQMKSLRKPQLHNNPTHIQQQANEHTTPTAGKSNSNAIHVSLPVEQVKNKVLDYSERCLVGILFGPRPSMEAMRAWVNDCWTNIGIEVTLTQALAKGYYLFMFKDASMAMKVISSGQWMFRHLPFCFMRWTKEFNPDGPKPSAYPVWVELSNLPSTSILGSRPSFPPLVKCLALESTLITTQLGTHRF